jgi:hypothetical protein
MTRDGALADALSANAALAELLARFDAAATT